MTEPQAGAEAQAAPDAQPEDTFSNHPEVGEIIVDDRNRPFLVLDVNQNDGSVIGLAFNVDGTSEVVTEHADNGTE